VRISGLCIATVISDASKLMEKEKEETPADNLEKRMEISFLMVRSVMAGASLH
jgi:hypothetical protein